MSAGASDLSGTTSFVLRWAHDDMRAKDAGTGGELTVRSRQSEPQMEQMIKKYSTLNAALRAKIAGKAA